MVSGGSTLTMQVARLLEDSGTGQMDGKIRQIRVALALPDTPLLWALRDAAGIASEQVDTDVADLSTLYAILQARHRLPFAERQLRVAVDGGGCSGFQYRFELVEAAEDDDLRIQADGQTALIDPVSVPFLKNSEIAYVDELAGAQFVVRNPNAASSCGCGVSFSI